MDALAELETTLASIPSAVVAFSGGVDSSVVAAAAVTRARRWRRRRDRGVARRSRAVSWTARERSLGRSGSSTRSSRPTSWRARPTVATTVTGATTARSSCTRCWARSPSGEGSPPSCPARTRTTSATGVRDSAPPPSAGSGTRSSRPGSARPRSAPSRARSACRTRRSPPRPASPRGCPTGRRSTLEVLAQVDRAEAALKRLGYRELRVRHFGTLARVELGAEDLARASTAEGRRRVEAAVRSAGYVDVEIEAFDRRRIPAADRDSLGARPRGRRSGSIAARTRTARTAPDCPVILP